MNIATTIFYFLFRFFEDKMDKKSKSSENIIILGESKVKIKCPKCNEEIYIDKPQEHAEERNVKCTQCDNNFIVKKNIK